MRRSIAQIISVGFARLSGGATREEEPFSEQQIATALTRLLRGARLVEVARKVGIHANTLRNWRRRYTGMDAAALRRYHQLEIDNSCLRLANRRLEREVAATVRKLLSRDCPEPADKPLMVKALYDEGFSEIRACAVVGQPRRTLSHQRRRALAVVARPETLRPR